MSEKNETTILVLSLLIVLSVLGGAFWWFTQGWRKPLEAKNYPPGAIAERTDSPTPSNQPSTLESFAKISDVPAGLFSYGGSTTWAPLRAELDPLIETVWPQFQLRYTQHPTQPPGSGTGIEMLLDNQLAFVQSSRSIKEEEYQQAQERGFTLREIPVAIDGIAIAVHPELNIPGLTVAELKDIYLGNITNWSQVGGPDIFITPYSRLPEDSGTIELFVENVLQNQAFGPNVEFLSTTTEALRAVSNNRGGIYYASAPAIVEQCSIRTLPIGRTRDRLVPPYQPPFVPPEDCPARRNQLNAIGFQTDEYPLTRRLFVIVKDNDGIEERAGEVYAQHLLMDRGQALIEKAGFVRIR